MLFAASIVALFALASATQCPPPGSVRYMVPHETDCSKFYICAHGVPLLQSCPEGTHFNSNFMVCQNPVFAGCSDELPESELECSWPDSVLFRPHPDSCGKYYVCEYGTPLVFDCPGGTEFNAELKECVWPHESNCNIGEATVPPQDGGSQNGGCVEGALSANQDCSKYNICNHGALVAQDCPPGLQWSSKVEQCVWPHESDCNNYGSDDSDSDAPENGGVEQDGSVGEDGGVADVEQDGGSGCEEGALTAHEDCNKYNKCNHGVAVAMDCPPGLHWNSILQYCDWPLTAGCV
ncbi:protein obstructor-E-like [Choristoneura fumiferana]|uniref:protein obstructor-E-like n=1 Tax=Choristoneura fumiferana TaxID=7141 RepID=UPI003D159EFA